MKRDTAQTEQMAREAAERQWHDKLVWERARTAKEARQALYAWFDVLPEERRKEIEAQISKALDSYPADKAAWERYGIRAMSVEDILREIYDKEAKRE